MMILRGTCGIAMSRLFLRDPRCYPAGPEYERPPKQMMRAAEQMQPLPYRPGAAGVIVVIDMMGALGVAKVVG